MSELLFPISTSFPTQRQADVEHGIETYDEEQHISTELVMLLRPGTHLELEDQNRGGHE